MSRTQVPRWTPPFRQSLRLALRPAIAYFVFCAGGFFALTGTVLAYEHGSGSELLNMILAFAMGVLGILAGQLVAVLRVRSFPVIVGGGMLVFGGAWFVAASGFPIPNEVAMGLFCFLFAFPCGLLSLQHRWDLFASFWPSVGWIGAVFVILNSEGRVQQWEQDKVAAWLPVPLALLGAFLVFWLIYLASKQAMRVELWQSLSGAAARRITRKATVTALPRKNLLPLLAVAAALFVVTALVAPFLWRTGKGDHASKEQQTGKEEPSRIPKVDGQAIAEMLQELADAAKKAAVNLWPLLLLVLFYRPAKRALLQQHLVTPLVPTPPSERIDNLWEYVRIAAEDAGVVPTASDSVEDLLARIDAAKLTSPAVTEAATIYVRTRYGFVVAVGDATRMRVQALAAARELRANLSTWDRVRNYWRALS